MVVAGPWQHLIGLIGGAHIALYRGSADRALGGRRRGAGGDGLVGPVGQMQWCSMMSEGSAAPGPDRRRPHGAGPAAAVEGAAQAGRSLERENHPYAAGYAAAPAPLAFAEGRRGGAAGVLASAAAAFEHAGDGPVRRRTRAGSGPCWAAKAGSEMAAQAEAWMKSENVVNVERITDCFVRGSRNRDDG